MGILQYDERVEGMNDMDQLLKTPIKKGEEFHEEDWIIWYKAEDEIWTMTRNGLLDLTKGKIEYKDQD